MQFLLQESIWPPGARVEAGDDGRHPLDSLDEQKMSSTPKGERSDHAITRAWLRASKSCDDSLVAVEGGYLITASVKLLLNCKCSA